MEKNKIILEAETELQDNALRDFVSKLDNKILNLNKRIDNQASDIRGIKAIIKLKETKQDG